MIEWNAFEWNPHDNKISLQGRTVSSRMTSQASSLHCENNKKLIWSHASYVGKHTGPARDASSIFSKPPAVRITQTIQNVIFLILWRSMKIKSSLVWNKK